MKILDRTCKSPEENLACDEALLELCESGGEREILRFWEPATHFVVLGYSNRIDSEARVGFCRRHGIPILRRPSGGGTVLQGPGCLNYSLVLPIHHADFGPTIRDTNAFVLGRHRAAIGQALGLAVEVRGHTDLTVGGLKFSGNSQRRKRRCLLFHGTFLLRFDIPLIAKTLAIPREQPAYRRNRPHKDFLMNLEAPAPKIKNALAAVWKADEVLKKIPEEEMRRLARDVYSNADWTHKF
ncbi:MAG: lipoate--protein ligase family protein [Candidatus Omnitrophica bacterium]|nr:lipoate--protein ligase family protein [Candidatus Omnitrophota bacterium]